MTAHDRTNQRVAEVARDMTSDSTPAEPVAILGATGALGFGLAVRLARARVRVTIGSRDAARASEAAGRVCEMVPGAPVDGAANADAVRAAGLVFLTVPFKSQAETLAGLREALASGQVLIDATVPLAVATGGKATRVLRPWQGSAAEQAQELVPDGVSVVSALHTVSAATLTDLTATLSEDVLVCGRRREDKRRVAEIIDQVDGLRCVDAGPLEQARIVEPITAMLIGINGRYKTHAGLRVTSLPEGDLFPPLASGARRASR
jgi:NADPH-dependent F420 reductase